MIPHNEEHRLAIEGVRQQIWELYRDLKAYKEQPQPELTAALTARFEALCAQRTGYPSVNGVLSEMRGCQADLLRVLDRPETPLHNNGSESDIRDYVKKRKISGSTRSDDGRRCRDTFASLKKTCRKLGVRFWDYLRDRIGGLGMIPRLADMIRERAACGLAQSGMLSEKQRRSAVPRLLDFADDASLDADTHKWVFQALRDITGQSLPHDAAAWKSWYNSSNGNWVPVTRDSQ